MKLHYFSAAPNFGDALNPWLWPPLVGDRLDADERRLFIGIGSILNPHVPRAAAYHVLGSGCGYGPIPLSITGALPRRRGPAPRPRPRRALCAPQTADRPGACRRHWSGAGAARRLARLRSLPDLASVGWDIALAEKGPILIEANLHWGVTVTTRLGDTAYVELLLRPDVASRIVA